MNEIKNNLLKYKEYIINQFKTNRKRSMAISLCLLLVIYGLFNAFSNSNKRKVLKIRKAIYNSFFKENHNKTVSNCIADVSATQIIRKNLINAGYKFYISKEKLTEKEVDKYVEMTTNSLLMLQICYK